TGLGISVLAIAVTNYLLSRMSVYQAADAAIWLTGSLGAASWQRIGLTGAALIALLPLLALVSRPLHAMAVGEELAAGLGVPVAAVRWLGIGLATALAAVAVSMTGPIAFVAFVSGPVARRLSGGRHTLVGSALVGAILVVLADFAAANLIPGGRLPVGVITGLVGAPVLLWLVAGDHRERT
ncbi:iron chelate uptake ABC transporter family permease subunit, partial [Amycolatopsis sp. H6(2020)]|nr:iron chelate uptake ABC transporter family permease subunit [Amycolatopsis sp. H6(2020)]